MKTTRVGVEPFRPTRIEEVVAYACVCAINNEHGRELEECKKRMRTIQMQLRDSKVELNAAVEKLAKRKAGDTKLDGKLVYLCAMCEELEPADATVACGGCDERTCTGCINECDACHKERCSDCLRQCTGGGILTCRELLCEWCADECDKCGDGPFCGDHVDECCSAEDKEEEEEEEAPPPPPPPPAKKKAKTKRKKTTK